MWFLQRQLLVCLVLIPTKTYKKLSYEKFKQAVKALPINIEMLTKGKLNDTTHIKRANAA